MEQQPSALPIEITFMRHGFSEANAAQRADKRGEDMTPHLGVYDKHDFEQRLHPEGITQAKQARAYMLDNGLAPEDYDDHHASPFYRTLETAAYVGGENCEWLPEIRLIERDWGAYGAMLMKERQEQFPHTERMKALSSFFARYDGGESIYDTVFRVRNYIGTLAREATDKRILAVTHGEFMWATRFLIERMQPPEWQELDGDKTQRIGNCALLQYSRANPEDPDEVKRSLANGWRRMIDPINPQKSPYGGEWVKLEGKKRYRGSQLLNTLDSN